MEENLAQEYFVKIMEQKQAGGYLLKLLCEVLEVDFPNVERIKYLKMFNKYIKMYGRRIAFLSLLDMLDMDLDLGREKGLYPLYSYLCKKRFVDAIDRSKLGESQDLHEWLEKQKKDSANVREDLLESPLND